MVPRAGMAERVSAHRWSEGDVCSRVDAGGGSAAAEGATTRAMLDTIDTVLVGASSASLASAAADGSGGAELIPHMQVPPAEALIALPAAALPDEVAASSEVTPACRSVSLARRIPKEPDSVLVVKDAGCCPRLAISAEAIGKIMSGPRFVTHRRCAEACTVSFRGHLSTRCRRFSAMSTSWYSCL
jgi:hypothetical protein